MDNIFIKGLCVLVVCLSALLSVQVGESESSPTYSLTDQDLDDLLAPIALYPDPLLAQILSASTYPTEVADAAAWLNGGGDPSSIDDQNWDESVKAIAHYPDILNMMAENMDWTADLGDAFLNQPEDVTSSIQRLRWEARSVGNLESTNQQTVNIDDGDYIQIIPAQPEYIYVPQYDPSVIYVQRWASGISPFITFGLGLTIGSWLSMDFDWHQHHVIYHGWNRRGWVNNARPYIHITNVYIHGSRPFINQTWRHDALHGDPDNYRASRPSSPSNVRNARMHEIRGRDVTAPRPLGGMFGPKGDTEQYSNRGKESLGAVGQRPTTSAPSIGSSFSQPSYRSENMQQPARAPSSTFGGYRGDSETRTQSLRGQTSRQSSVGVYPSPAPVSRGGAPAGRSTIGGR